MTYEEWTNFVGALHGGAAAYLVDVYVPHLLSLPLGKLDETVNM